MVKAILVAVFTVFIGILAEAWGECGIGCIVSVAVMGAFIIYFNEKKK